MKVTIKNPLLQTMMKWIVIAASLAASAQAFVPLSTTTPSRATALNAAFPGNSQDGFTGKPAYKAQSTKPEAVRKVSKRERQKMPDVMIEPSYFLTVGVGLLCPLIIWYHPCK